MIQVRPSIAADAEAVASVRVASWRAAFRDFIPADYLAGMDPGQHLERLRALLTDQPDQFSAWVAERGGEIIGFCHSGAPRYPTSKGVHELWAIYVLPEHWRQQAGRLLVEEVLARAASFRCVAVELWTIKGNDQAQRAYEKYGFALTGQERVNSSFAGASFSEVLYRRLISQ